MRRGIFVGAVLALALVGCGDDAGRGATSEEGAEVRAEATGPPGSVVPASLLSALAEGTPGGPYLAATAIDGTVVALGPEGGLLRIAEDGSSTVVDTEGVAEDDDGQVERELIGLVGLEGRLLAFGDETDLVADVVPPSRPVLWGSDDGERWERVADEGLQEGTDEVRLGAMTVTDEGEVLALGTVDEGEGPLLTLWRSDDGEQWRRDPTPGLGAVGRDDQWVVPLAVAAIDDTILATARVDGQDDERLELVRSVGGGAWAEVEPSGLEDLDVPNGAVLAPLGTLGDGFALFGGAPVEAGEVFGEWTATLFTSPDGVAWAAEALDGPTLPAFEALAALVTTDDGATGISVDRDGLVLWRLEP